ncbi:MAG TPA: hypothetical protein VMS04_03060 [Vicinamibacterales bacterium]|nr:hypothetical protein [Vicinamibacterales bacterium]
MFPCQEALVPCLMCPGCGRLVPITGARPVRASRANERAILRAARRQKLRRERT